MVQFETCITFNKKLTKDCWHMAFEAPFGVL